MEVFVRNPFNYDTDEVSESCGLGNFDESKTQQSFLEECDINTIIRRFGLGGDIPTGVRMPVYGDFTGINDFQSAMNAIAVANEAFDAMPAEVRRRFNHDPGQFVDFCLDDKNRDEAVKLGLVPDRVTEAVAASRPVPDREERVPPESAAPAVVEASKPVSKVKP